MVRAAPPELYLLQDFKMLVKGVSLAMKQVRGNVSQMGGGDLQEGLTSEEGLSWCICRSYETGIILVREEDEEGGKRLGRKEEGEEGGVGDVQA